MSTSITIPTSSKGYYLRPNERWRVRPQHAAGSPVEDAAKHEREWNIPVLPECRLQVRPNRFRVPDIMVIPRGEKPDRIMRTAPLLCIEVRILTVDGSDIQVDLDAVAADLAD